MRRSKTAANKASLQSGHQELYAADGQSPAGTGGTVYWSTFRVRHRMRTTRTTMPIVSRARFAIGQSRLNLLTRRGDELAHPLPYARGDKVSYLVLNGPSGHHVDDEQDTDPYAPEPTPGDVANRPGETQDAKTGQRKHDECGKPPSRRGTRRQHVAVRSRAAAAVARPRKKRMANSATESGRGFSKASRGSRVSQYASNLSQARASCLSSSRPVGTEVSHASDWGRQRWKPPDRLVAASAQEADHARQRPTERSPALPKTHRDCAATTSASWCCEKPARRRQRHGGHPARPPSCPQSISSPPRTPHRVRAVRGQCLAPATKPQQSATNGAENPPIAAHILSLQPARLCARPPASTLITC
jgi:hypothetical protein